MEGMDVDFNAELENDRKAEKEMDELLDAIREVAKNMDHGDGVSVINPLKVKEVEAAYKMIKCSVGGSAVISYKLNKPVMGMAAVNITGKDIVIKDPDKFVQAVSLATNLDMYPKLDGTVEIDLTFHNLLFK